MWETYIRCTQNDFTGNPLLWHGVLCLLASIQILIRHLRNSFYANDITIWDMGSWLTLFITGILVVFSECSLIAWLHYIIFSPLLFAFGFWFSERILRVTYNEGAIAHMVAIYIYILMVAASAIVLLFRWLLF